MLAIGFALLACDEGETEPPREEAPVAETAPAEPETEAAPAPPSQPPMPPVEARPRGPGLDCDLNVHIRSLPGDPLRPLATDDGSVLLAYLSTGAWWRRTMNGDGELGRPRRLASRAGGRFHRWPDLLMGEPPLFMMGVPRRLLPIAADGTPGALAPGVAPPTDVLRASFGPRGWVFITKSDDDVLHVLRAPAGLAAPPADTGITLVQNEVSGGMASGPHADVVIGNSPVRVHVLGDGPSDVARIDVARTDAWQIAVAAASDGFLVVWSTIGGSVLSSIALGVDGRPAGSAQQISPEGVNSVSGLRLTSFSGGYAATFWDIDVPALVRLGRDGRPSAPPLKLGPEETDVATTVNAVDADGTLVVTWGVGIVPVGSHTQEPTRTEGRVARLACAEL